MNLKRCLVTLPPLKRSAKWYAAYETTLRGRLPVLPVDNAVGAAFATLKAAQHRASKRVPDLDLLYNAVQS